jgi:putative SOS response-associated peptidase YedK
MPAILTDKEIKSWLNPIAFPKELQQLLHPFNSDETEFFEVDTRVNNPINNDACLIKRLI